MAAGERVALAASAIHQRGIFTKGSAFLRLIGAVASSSAFLRSAHSGLVSMCGLLLPTILREETEHGLPGFDATPVGVPAGVAHDGRVSAQLVWAVWIGVEHDAGGPPHDLPRERHVGLDALGRCLD